MTQVFADAARAELAAPILATDTTFLIKEFGERFPAASVGEQADAEGFRTAPGNWFKVVLQDKDDWEIVYVGVHEEDSNTFSDVLRGQDGTVAKAFPASTVVGIRPTAGNASDWEAKQEELVSGSNIKTVNGESLLGLGNISVLSGIFRDARTSATPLGEPDKGKLIDITSGTFTQTFDACATLGDGWFVYLKNSGTGDITLDPAGSETIDGLTSYIMYPGEVRLVQCDGVALRSIVVNAFSKTFTTSGPFTKPPGYSAYYIEAMGAGSGASGTEGQTAGVGGSFKTSVVANNSMNSQNTVVIGANGGSTSMSGIISAPGAGGASYGVPSSLYDGGNNGGLGGRSGGTSFIDPITNIYAPILPAGANAIVRRQGGQTAAGCPNLGTLNNHSLPRGVLLTVYQFTHGAFDFIPIKTDNSISFSYVLKFNKGDRSSVVDIINLGRSFASLYISNGVLFGDTSPYVVSNTQRDYYTTGADGLLLNNQPATWVKRTATGLTNGTVSALGSVEYWGSNYYLAFTDVTAGSGYAYIVRTNSTFSTYSTVWSAYVTGPRYCVGSASNNSGLVFLIRENVGSGVASTLLKSVNGTTWSAVGYSGIPSKPIKTASNIIAWVSHVHQYDGNSTYTLFAYSTSDISTVRTATLVSSITNPYYSGPYAISQLPSCSLLGDSDTVFALSSLNLAYDSSSYRCYNSLAKITFSLTSNPVLVGSVSSLINGGVYTGATLAPTSSMANYAYAIHQDVITSCTELKSWYVYQNGTSISSVGSEIAFNIPESKKVWPFSTKGGDGFGGGGGGACSGLGTLSDSAIKLTLPNRSGAFSDKSSGGSGFMYIYGVI